MYRLKHASRLRTSWHQLECTLRFSSHVALVGCCRTKGLFDLLILGLLMTVSITDRTSNLLPFCFLSSFLGGDRLSWFVCLMAIRLRRAFFLFVKGNFLVCLASTGIYLSSARAVGDMRTVEIVRVKDVSLVMVGHGVKQIDGGIA
jgi:hypothetical protein